jgi:rod shape-determining protein MreB and related proteins
MFNPFTKLNRKVGIDLGSARTRIWVQDHGLIIDEPSLIAVDQATQKVMAVGEQAFKMKDRVSGKVQVFAPVQQPKITDDVLVKAMLKVFLQQASQQAYFFSPTMLVALPSNIYPVMREVLTKVLTELGANEVAVVDQTLAAAIGAGVPVADASGTFVLQMGAQVVEATSLSMSKIVKTFASNQAGDALCQDLIYWFKENKNLAISGHMAQDVLHKLCSFLPGEQMMTVSGLLVKDGSLQEIETSAQEIAEVVNTYGSAFTALAKKLLANIPPSLVVDIVDKGLLLSGGLAQVDGLEDYLTRKLGVPVFLAEEPETCVIKGVGQIMENLEDFRQDA